MWITTGNSGLVFVQTVNGLLIIHPIAKIKIVVIEKFEKRKSQIGINSGNFNTFSWWIHLQLLQFPERIFSFIVFHLRLLSLIIPIWLFPFFHFSKTMLLQSGVNVKIYIHISSECFMIFMV